MERKGDGELTNVPDLSALDQVMQSLHGLLDRYGVVEAMDLQEIQVIGAQSVETGIDGIEDGGTREATLVDIVLGAANLVGPSDVTDARFFADDTIALGQED